MEIRKGPGRRRRTRWQADEVLRRIYIGFIYVHPNVAAKIQARTGGGCTVEEVIEAFQNGPQGAEMLWRPNTEPPEIAGFGETASGKRLFASMVGLDVPDGSWSLMTAWPVRGNSQGDQGSTRVNWSAQ